MDFCLRRFYFLDSIELMTDLIIIFSAKYLLYIIALIALIFFVLANRNIKIRIIKSLIVSAPLALILAKISSLFIYDIRPFAAENVIPLISHAADNGFPSDHTLAAMLIAIVIFKFNKKLGTVLIILAILLGVARVLAKIHHPLDIIGSIIIDLVSVWIAIWVLKKFSSNSK